MLLPLTALLGCGAGPEPVVDPPPPALRRLTQRQYHNTLRDLFGDDLVLPTSLEPDVRFEGMPSLGAARASISPIGVERYERAAASIAEQVLADAAALPCTPDGPGDDGCAVATVRQLATEVYRRPPTDDEVDRLAALLLSVASAEGAFLAGARVAFAALLQSPHFLYRIEHTPGALDPYELASRLAYFLWNGPPDDELLAAAADGSLLEPRGRRRQVDRMLDDPRFRRGVRDFFTELYHLDGLGSLTKDPTVFRHASPELWASAREETLALIEDNVVDRGDDFHAIYTTRRTFIDRRLAALYEVPAPTTDGFAWTELPESAQRAGLLGHASVLALNAHPTSSSATRRGKFIRGTLLCQFIPPPPADVDTSIPEASDAPTLRDRLLVHQEDPSCSGCHIPLDSVGLGLENFDGEARWRDRENQAPIDPSGQLDGVDFDDMLGLGRAIADAEAASRCITERVVAYAQGHPVERGQDELIDWLHDDFVAQGRPLRRLLRQVALSEAFATGGTP